MVVHTAIAMITMKAFFCIVVPNEPIIIINCAGIKNRIAYVNSAVLASSKT
jgi:hypothetical protein